MRVEKYIVQQWAFKVEKLVIARAKHQLRLFGKNTTLSGDDSPLQNPWDEICAQQQGEESAYWSAYQELIDQILLDQFEQLDQAAQLALWSQTAEGFDWIFDHHADEDGHEQAAVDHQAVTHYLRQQLLREATDEDNPRVYGYLHGRDTDVADDDDTTWTCLRIISGGQTGVDRAALDFAIERGYPHGGWMPRGREAEDGPIPPKYQLTELAEGGYRQRTKRNVEDSNGTLIVNVGTLDGGTLATQRFAQRLGRPCFIAQLDTDTIGKIAARLAQWLDVHAIQTLNVAGPRESKRPGIYDLTRTLLEAIAPSHASDLNRDLPPQKGPPGF